MAKEVKMSESGGTVGFFAVVCAMAYVLFGAMGCAGMEVGGKLGVYRVDERQESQKTYHKPIPWKCYLTQCSPEEVQGS